MLMAVTPCCPTTLGRGSLGAATRAPACMAERSGTCRSWARLLCSRRQLACMQPARTASRKSIYCVELRCLLSQRMGMKSICTEGLRTAGLQEPPRKCRDFSDSAGWYEAEHTDEE